MKIENDSLQKPRILVVEDNELNMELVTALLEAAGHGVLQADSGETAIGLALRENPSLILMDLSLPGMNGLQTAAAPAQKPAFGLYPDCRADRKRHARRRGTRFRRGLRRIHYKAY